MMNVHVPIKNIIQTYDMSFPNFSHVLRLQRKILKYNYLCEFLQIIFLFVMEYT